MTSRPNEAEASRALVSLIAALEQERTASSPAFATHSPAPIESSTPANAFATSHELSKTPSATESVRATVEAQNLRLQEQRKDGPSSDLLSALTASLSDPNNPLLHSHTMSLLAAQPRLLQALTLAPPSPRPVTRASSGKGKKGKRAANGSGTHDTFKYTPLPTRSGRVPQKPEPKSFQENSGDRDTVLFNDYFDWPSSDDEDPDFQPNLWSDLNLEAGNGFAGTAEFSADEFEFGGESDSVVEDEIEFGNEALNSGAATFVDGLEGLLDVGLEPLPTMELPTMPQPNPPDFNLINTPNTVEPLLATNAPPILKTSRKRARREKSGNAAEPSHAQINTNSTNNALASTSQIPTPNPPFSSSSTATSPPAAPSVAPRHKRKNIYDGLTEAEKIALKKQKQREAQRVCRERNEKLAQAEKQKLQSLERENVLLKRKVNNLEDQLVKLGAAISNERVQSVEELPDSASDDTADDTEQGIRPVRKSRSRSKVKESAILAKGLQSLNRDVRKDLIKMLLELD